LLEGSLLHIDETVVQVLKEKDKKPTSQSYMWVQTGGPPDKPVLAAPYTWLRQVLRELPATIKL